MTREINNFVALPKRKNLALEVCPCCGQSRLKRQQEQPAPRDWVDFLKAGGAEALRKISAGIER